MKSCSKLFLLFSISILMMSTITAQYQNVKINNAGSTDPEEVTIAINPVNPNILAAGANISYFYRSTDAGQTWTQSLMNSTLGVWGDPCVLFDSLGNLYYGHLSNPNSGYWIDRIVIQRSTNNGMNWNDGAGIGFNNPKNQDKEWIATDMTQSIYRDNMYVSWTEFDNYGSGSSSDSSRILFSRSIDHGITWSAPVRLSDRGGDCFDSDNTVEGAVPAVGPNGEIYVCWAGPLGLMLDKSTDGGVTFGQDIFVADFPGGWDYGIPGIWRSNGLPITAADISNSPYRGNVYVCWSDQSNGESDTDIFIVKSTDGGQTWNSPVRVNDDATTRHQFFVWMTVDPTTGAIYTVFYDRRNTTGSATDVYVARSTDGGDTFENFKVSETSFTPSSSIFFGDYTNIAAFNKKVYPIWMRLDGSNLSVWTALIDDSTVTVPVELTSFTAAALDGKIYLDWQTATEKNNRGFEIQRTTAFNGTNGNTKRNWSTIGFAEGNGTTSEQHNYEFVDQPFESGNYFYRLKQIDYDGSFEYSKEIEVKFLAALDFQLNQNYPNPFNPSTTIGYELPEKSYVTIKIYDVLGKEVKSLVEGIESAGVHEVLFDASDLSSGIYLYKMKVGELEFSRSMIFMK